MGLKWLETDGLGMLLAAEVYTRVKSFKQVSCAKLHHHNDQRCLFRCTYPELLRAKTSFEIRQAVQS